MAKRNRRVGYGLPVVLAIVVHVAALLLTMLRLPESEPTPSSSSVVQATLVSDVTVTDQAQYAKEARARAAQRQAEEAAQQAAEQQSQEEAQQAAEQQAQEEAQQQEAERQAAAEQAEAESERRQQAAKEA
ncbi:hypothetical protein BTW08_17805, partial [Salinicola sp. MH3R3-1]